PRQRLAFMLRDSGARVVLTQEGLLGSLPDGDFEVVSLDGNASDISRESPERPASSSAPRDLAYVIYTSGSTGQPKGVSVPQGALVNLLEAMRERPGLDASDTLLAVTTVSFDIAALELLLPLTVGARVALAPAEAAADGARLAEELFRSQATVLQATPT